MKFHVWIDEDIGKGETAIFFSWKDASEYMEFRTTKGARKIELVIDS